MIGWLNDYGWLLLVVLIVTVTVLALLALLSVLRLEDEIQQFLREQARREGG